MKLTAVNNTNRQNKRTNNTKNNINTKNKSVNNNTNNSSKVNFKGIADSATLFWNFVDAGGRGLQFTVEDMLGTNFPRTYKGAMAGYEYTHEINWASVMQEGIREFLTGPTMTLAPYAVLWAATKKTGKSANTHIENIINISHIASTLAVKKNEEYKLAGQEYKPTPEKFKTDFIREATVDMLRTSTGKKELEDKDIEKIIDGINKYNEKLENASKATTKASKKAGKKEAEKSLDELNQAFKEIVKNNVEEYKNINFHNAKYSVSQTESTIKSGETNFKNYIKYINAYIEDYIKNNSITNNTETIVNLTKNNIDKFKQSWVGKRAFIVTSMIGLTALALSFIPKLYTLASGGVNPNAAGIYNEAKKRGNA